jgi:hypothetical protein
MAKSNRGITRDNIFSFGRNKSTLPQQGIAPQEQKTHQTAVWLGNEEERWLDGKCAEIKNGGWRSITRSAFIRALVQVAMQQNINVEDVTGEAELINRLASK